MSAPTTTEKKPKKAANKKTADVKEESPTSGDSSQKHSTKGRLCKIKKRRIVIEIEP